ncbi:hypothetical protein JRO89_XS05G0124400 [Xanthoceras sorbifolium]|uniref:Uncharacterized protein n=1 Tax=Xanthoceras sorbifolium TaxID=99658 RepID=A0ABQ8I248_9ROSI|nr:hypothetical protein JRO89_XS05G0124400 [Xanthoceras sorbifolium]
MGRSMARDATPPMRMPLIFVPNPSSILADDSKTPVLGKGTSNLLLWCSGVISLPIRSRCISRWNLTLQDQLKGNLSIIFITKMHSMHHWLNYICVHRKLEGPNFEQMTLTDLLQLEKQLDATLTQTKARKSFSKYMYLHKYDATADGVMTLHEKLSFNTLPSTLLCHLPEVYPMNAIIFHNGEKIAHQAGRNGDPSFSKISHRPAEGWSGATETLPVTLFPPCNLFSVAHLFECDKTFCLSKVSILYYFYNKTTTTTSTRYDEKSANCNIFCVQGSHSKYSNLLSYARLLQIAQRQFVYPIHCQDAQHASLLELYFVFTGNLKGQTLS